MHHLSRLAQLLLAVLIGGTVVAALLVVGFSSGQERTDGQARPRLDERLRAVSVVVHGRLGASRTRSLGVVVDGRAHLVALPAHLVEGVRELRVRHEGRMLPAWVHQIDTCSDVALVRFAGKARVSAFAVPERPPPSSAVEDVRVLGLSDARVVADDGVRQRTFSPSRAVVDDLPRHPRLIEYRSNSTAALAGGLVVDVDGRLVGISLGVVDGDRHYAIPIEAWRSLLLAPERARSLGISLTTTPEALLARERADASSYDNVVRTLRGRQAYETLTVLGTDVTDRFVRPGAIVAKVNGVAVYDLEDVCEAWTTRTAVLAGYDGRWEPSRFLRPWTRSWTRR